MPVPLPKRQPPTTSTPDAVSLWPPFAGAEVRAPARVCTPPAAEPAPGQTNPHRHGRDHGSSVPQTKVPPWGFYFSFNVTAVAFPRDPRRGRGASPWFLGAVISKSAGHSASPFILHLPAPSTVPAGSLASRDHSRSVCKQRETPLGTPTPGRTPTLAGPPHHVLPRRRTRCWDPPTPSPARSAGALEGGAGQG